MNLWQATIKLSRPGTSVTDDNLTSEIITDHSLAEGAARAVKALWGDSIKPVTGLERTIRKEYNQITFPGIGGIRLVVLAERDQFLSRMAAHQATYNALASAFIDEYDTPGGILDKERLRFAAAHPNGVFRIEDYPSKSSLAESFDFSFAVMPMPEPSAFLTKHFAADASASLAAEYEKKLAAAHQNVRNQILKMLIGLISETATSLSGTGPIFDHDNRKGPFAKLQEYLDRIPGLLSSLGSDPHIEEIYAAARSKLSVSAEHLRSNKVFRQNAALQAQLIATQFGGLGKRKLSPTKAKPKTKDIA